ERISGDESVVLAENGIRLADFRFEDRLRVDAAMGVAELRELGLPIEIVSGDREASVGSIAAELGIPHLAAVLPCGKAAHIAARRRRGDVGIIHCRRRQRASAEGAAKLGAASRSVASGHRSSGGRRMMDYFYLIPIAIGLGLTALAAFMWSLRSGQYDDLDGAAERILHEDTDAPIRKTPPAV